MTDPQAIFRAGRTMRWHTNPDLSHTTDPLDGHQGRVARIIWAIWPDASRDLLIAALTHDEGESVTGDKPWTCPKTKEEAAQEEIARRKIWGRELPKLTPEDARRLKYADRLDAYQWAAHHAPHIMGRADWIEAKQWLEAEEIILSASERAAA